VKTKRFLCFIGILVIGLPITISFAGQGTETGTLTLDEMSLEQLQAQEERFRREAEQARWEIDSILQIINREKEIEERKKEKKDVIDSYSAEHQVELMKPEVERLQRQLDALLEKERLIGQRLSLTQQAQEARLRIIELQRQPKFRHYWLGFGMLADGKSGTGTDSTPSEFFAEIGARIPAGKKYTAIGPFVGAYHGQCYAGIEGFIPVVPPKQGDSGGSWVKIGVAYGKRVSALFGLNIGDERWQLTFRYWAGTDVELPLQFGVAYLF